MAIGSSISGDNSLPLARVPSMLGLCALKVGPRPGPPAVTGQGVGAATWPALGQSEAALGSRLGTGRRLPSCMRLPRAGGLRVVKARGHGDRDSQVGERELFLSGLLDLGFCHL